MTTLVPSLFDGPSSVLQITRAIVYESLDAFEFPPDPISLKCDA